MATPPTKLNPQNATDKHQVTGMAHDGDARFTQMDSKVVDIAGKEQSIYSHLPATEINIIKNQVDIPVVKSGWRTLYRYATTVDFIIIATSTICSIAAGAALPLMTVIFGNLAGAFSGYFQGTITRASFDDTIIHMILYFVYVGIAEFCTVYISTVGFIYTGEHISGKMRSKYLEACLRQNIGLFDTLGSGEIVTRITADMNLVQDGISEKVGLTLNTVASFVTAFIISFIKSWRLTLILSATVFSITTIMGVGSTFILKYNKLSLESHALGGTVVEEVISSIRNTAAFENQDRFAKRYDEHLAAAEKFGYKVKFVLTIMGGGIFMVLYLNYGLAFWMGSRYLLQGSVSLGSILTILMSIMIGAFSMGNVAPNIQAFTSAIAATANIFNIIDRSSPLDPMPDAGRILDHIEGTVELRNIKHIYPSRPEVTVLQDFSLRFPASKKTALVGASGSGKSTIIGLIERFYDPVGGHIFLDGHDISTLNIRWLRQQISVVSQELTLFRATFFENIRHGLIGMIYEQEMGEKHRARVVEAAKMANAHDFITALPQAYETQVGERGLLLSGGQKQRRQRAGQPTHVSHVSFVSY